MRRWGQYSDDELAYIRKWWGRKSKAQIGEELGVSKGAVANQARKMNLPKLDLHTVVGYRVNAGRQGQFWTTDELDAMRQAIRDGMDPAQIEELFPTRSPRAIENKRLELAAEAEADVPAEQIESVYIAPSIVSWPDAAQWMRQLSKSWQPSGDIAADLRYINAQRAALQLPKFQLGRFALNNALPDWRVEIAA